MIMEKLILSVEDSPDDILLFSLVFQKIKISARVQFLTDGEKAIEYFSPAAGNPIPILLLLDLKLPKKSGLEVLAWVRSQPLLKRLPIVVLTSSSQLEDIDQAYDLGANSYLVKPGEIDKLIELARAIETYWLKANTPPSVVPLRSNTPRVHPSKRVSADLDKLAAL